LKDLRNRINKKINKNYNQRQKILNEIKQTLDIDFNKISVYSSVIEIYSYLHDPSAEFKVDSQNKIKTINEKDVTYPTIQEKNLFSE
jgi:hypothetical protein